MQLRLSRIALIHALCQVPAMLVLARFAAESVVTAWTHDHRIVGLVEWSSQPLPPKIQSIVEYGLLLAMGAALVLAVTAYVRANGRAVAFSSRHWAAFAIYEGACLLPVLVLSESGFMVAAWFFPAMVLPAWLASRYLRPSDRVDRFVLVVSGACLALVLWSLSGSSWSPQPRFLNDYSDSPEHTFVGSGRLVENVGLRLTRSVFSSAHEPFLLFPPGRGLVYDWDKEVLFAHHRLGYEQIVLIRAVWGLKGDEAAVVRFIATAEDFASEAEVSKKAAVEMDFFVKKQVEPGMDAQSGAFFSRHARLYLPALEKAEFPGQSMAPVEYGEGLTRALGWLLHESGAPTFQSYYTIYWTALAAYLALLGIVVLLITRDAWAGVAALALGTGAVLVIGNDALRKAPEFSAMWHFPDLLCLLAVAIDARRRSYGSVALRAAAIGLLFWWNREFGLFFLGGSLAWLLIEISAGDRGWRGGIRQAGLEVAVVLAVLLAAGIGRMGDLAHYNLTGIGSSVLRWRDFLGWVFLWTALIGWLVWACFWAPRDDGDRSRDYLTEVAGVGALYAALASVYAVWNYSRNYKGVVLLLTVVPFVAIVVWAGKSSVNGPANFRWLMRYVTVVSVAIVVVFTVVDQVRQWGFERAFEANPTFIWNFRGFSGISAADPALMRDSVALIGKHQPEGRILLLSRYESVLRVLDNRAGVLPYNDLRGALVSWEMIDKVADQIVRSGAPILFIDRDILANREGQIPFIGGKPDPVAVQRVGSLAALGLLSRIVARCYVPGEIRGALQVWHRSCKPDGL